MARHEDLGASVGTNTALALRVITMSPAIRYALAIGVAAIAVAIRLIFDPVWGTRLPFITMFPATVLSAWLGGFWPGIVTTGICAASAQYLWLQPAYSWAITDTSDVVGLFLFLAIGAIICALNEAWRRGTVAAEHVASELRQQAQLLQTIDDAIYEMDADLAITSWNAAAERLYGYTAAEAIGRKGFELLRSSVSPEERSASLKRLEDGEVLRTEAELRRKDGSPVWADVTALARRTAEGVRTGFISIHRDITARKRADERFRLAVEAAPAAMILIDRHGTVVMTNALAEQLLGYARDEIVGHPVDRLVPLRFRERHPGHRASFFAAPHARPMGAGRDLYALRKDGAEVPVEIGLSPIETADGLFVLAAVTDITARKSAEAALRARTDELERVLDVIPAAVWTARDPDCRQIVGNQAAAALFGVPQDCNVSQTLSPDQAPIGIRHFRNGRELPASELPMQRAAATRQPQPVEELEVELPDGKRLTILGGAIALLDDAGNVRGVVSAFSDITERKAMEEQRAQLLVREQAVRADVERASRLKDEFLAVLSHELRTPLNAVLGYAHLLTSGALSPEKTQHALAVIQKNAQAQTRLVESLLDLSRIMAGKLELNLERLDISKVVDAALDVIRPDADAKRLRLEFNAPTAPVSLVGDAHRLQQVFWNLLSNAVKFTPAAGKIIVSVTVQGDETRITITDNGQGIGAEFLPYVFDRFRQEDSHKGLSPTGLGLGLALVREMIQAHGGTVVAASPGDGQGSTFTVTLPSASSTGAVVPGSDIGPAKDVVESLPELRVLVVDDDGDVRDVLALLLESRGATVLTASSVTEALAAISEDGLDVLLADIRMPDEDGYSLITKVRTREREEDAARLPAIAVTANASASDRDVAIEAGFDGHVSKPVDPDALVRSIVRVAAAAKTADV